MAVLSTVGFRGAAAESATLSLCTARPDGIYHFAAQQFTAALPAQDPRIEIVETRGSLDNLDRMERQQCDAAFVQRDALMAYALRRATRRLKIVVPITLYDELLHLVCRRDSGIEDVGDLRLEPQRYTLLTGEPDSGSAGTWQALTRLDRTFSQVATHAVGGRNALTVLTSDQVADCMLVVIGPNAPFMRAVDAAGDGLRLVPLDLYAFRDAELVDNRVYHSAVIPAGTYDKLQSEDGTSETETIAVAATLVITRSWANAHPGAYRALRGAVAEVKPAILERVRRKFQD